MMTGGYGDTLHAYGFIQAYVDNYLASPQRLLQRRAISSIGGGPPKPRHPGERYCPVPGPACRSATPRQKTRIAR